MTQGSEYAAVPQEMKALNNWVAYKKVWNKERKKYDKLPYNAKTGRMAKSNDVMTWCSFEKAVGALKNYDGIGFMFGNGIFGVDLDNVDLLDDPIIDEFLEALPSYAEVSPSGEGIHIYCKGSLPGKSCRKNDVEMYDHGRFFTVTGKHIGKSLELTDCGEAIKPLYEKYIGYDKPKEKATSAEELLTDEEIIQKISRATNNEKFKKLYYEGHSPGDDESSNDMALAGLLAFYSHNVEQLERLMRGSALVRKKWDTHERYLTDITIRKAISGKPLWDKNYNTSTPKKDFGDDINLKNRDVRFIEFVDSLKSEPIQEHKFLVDRLIFENGVNLISGDPKTYKTYIGMDICIGVATGHDVLGNKVNEVGKVLFISTEFDTRERLVKMLKGKGLDYSKINNFIVPSFNTLDSFQWNTDRDFLISEIEKYKPKLIVIDPLTYIFDGDINKNEDVRELFREFKKIIIQFNTTFLLIHHNNRMGEVKRMNNVSGASAITRFADSVMYLERIKEEEVQDISLSDEDIDKGPKEIKLIKGAFRYGREGYKYHKITFHFSEGKINLISERLDTKENRQNVPKKMALEIIEDDIKLVLSEKKVNTEMFTARELLSVMQNIVGQEKSYFEKNVKIILKNMADRGIIKSIPGKGYTLSE